MGKCRLWCHEITQSANKIISANLAVLLFLSLLHVNKPTRYNSITELFVPYFSLLQIPGSPSDSSTLSGSLDYSYSPAQLPSYIPENLSSSASVDTRHCGYPSEDSAYHPSPSSAQNKGFPTAASVCCCASCEAEHLDAFRTAEFFSYPSADCVDFASSAAATNDFYTRETNCDICYT